MHARRVLLPLMLLLSMLIAACGSGTGAPVGNASTAAASTAAASTAAASAAASVAAADTSAAASAATDASAAAASVAGSTAATSGEPVEMRIAWWGSQARHDKTLKVIEMFQQAHPNIKITPEYGNFTDHWTKLATQAAGGNLPDIIQQDYAYISEWVARGQLLSLDEFASSGTLNLSTVSEAQLSGGKIDGKLYGVNLGTNALSVVYDPELFKQAGVEAPKADWTWTDLKTTATALHEKLGIAGVESFYGDQFFKLWLKENGKWLYNDDSTALGYDDDKLAEQFFQQLLDMQASGAMVSREFDAGRGTVGIEDSLIVTKKSAMLLVWSNQAAAIAQASGEGRTLEMTETPGAGTGTEGLYLKPSMFFSIASTTKHPNEAAMFIDYFINSPEANEVLAAERGVPIVPSVREALEPSVPAMQQKIFQYIGGLEKTAAPINPPDPTFHNKLIADVYTPLIDQLLYGEITPAQAATQFREQATAFIGAQ